jgi:hypothetical protein
LGQIRASPVAHWPQNVIEAGFSNPQFEQRTSSSRYLRDFIAGEGH